MAEQSPQVIQQQQEPTLSHPPSVMKTYNMFYTTSRLNVTLHLNSKKKESQPLYYASTTILSSNPSVHLHTGPSKSSPIVASARLHYTSRHILLSHNSASETKWEDLRREKFRLVRSDYEFDTNLGKEKGQRETYGWRVDKSYIKTLYRCVDGSGRNVANMYSGGFVNWRKGGEIEIVEGVDKGLEEMLIISALAIWIAEASWSALQGYEKGGGKSRKTSGSVA